MARADIIQEIVELLAKVQRPSKLTAWPKLGLTHGQLGALVMLSYHKRLQVKQIASFLGITNSAASQQLDPLVSKNLVKRQTDPQDRRIAYFEVTSGGNKLLKQLHKIKTADFRSKLENLNNDELELLAAICRKIAAAKTE
jgi:DNA-binding MarR family transcriptional regulator